MADAKKICVPEGDNPVEKHTAADDIEKFIIEAKKRRGWAKAALTQQMGMVDKLTADVRNVAQVKQKMANFSEAIQKLEATHDELLDFLTEQDQHADADKYETNVMSQVTEFWDTMQAWIAEQEDDLEVCDASREDLEVTKGAGNSVAWDTALEQDVTTSHLEEENEALKKSIEELSTQQQLEMANYKLQLQKEKQNLS